MKLKLTGILVSFTLLFGCSTVEEKENDLEEIGLNGKVKSIRVISYVAIDKFGKLSKGKRESKSNSVYDNHEYILFNEVGNKIEINTFSPDGNINSKGFFNITKKEIELR